MILESVKHAEKSPPETPPAVWTVPILLIRFFPARSDIPSPDPVRTDGGRREIEKDLEISGAAAFQDTGALGILLDDLGRGEEASHGLAASRPGEAELAEARLRLACFRAARGDRIGARTAFAEALAAVPRRTAKTDADPVLRELRGTQ